MKTYATFTALSMFLLLTTSCSKDALVAPQDNTPLLEEADINVLNATTPNASSDGGDSGPPSGITTTAPASTDVDMTKTWITPEGNFATE